MSKEAALRAMREAAYRERTARSTESPKAPTPAVRRAGTKAFPPTPPPATDALCGHRSMNGRTCTREQGHAAKSHRYSTGS
jgi:hypothetical protein